MKRKPKTGALFINTEYRCKKDGGVATVLFLMKEEKKQMVQEINAPIITGIDPDSIAEELQIAPGDLLLAMNGEAIHDIFDYRFHNANEALELTVQKKSGEVIVFAIEKDEREDLGLVFENPLINEEKGCTNNCVFCFIDQLPKGMRPSLYFKDDDARLSFLYGNYITMTNMKEAELDRIIHYKMSPINVSVHTTNTDLRIRMLGNRFAGNLLPRMQRLIDAGITVNAQIVLCRGWNDGEELERSLQDLSKMAPALHSISIVPIGLTKHRSGLAEMKAFERKSAGDVLRMIEQWQKTFLETVETRTVYASDEFYLLAEKEIPDAVAYEDFPQIENGVGMISALREEFYGELQVLKVDKMNNSAQKIKHKKLSIATGVSVQEEVAHLAEELAQAKGWEEAEKVQVLAVENHFFGGHVNVTGLLTGQDVVSQLTGKDLGAALLLCRSMFRADTEVMLDDMTRDDLENALGVPVHIIDPDGLSLIQAMLEDF